MGNLGGNINMRGRNQGPQDYNNNGMNNLYGNQNSMN